jgi:putative ATP-dependent endonuclease of OLD family
VYLYELKLWNFRKYGADGQSPDKRDPDLSLQLQPGLNVLIGENGSGKTTIVDAIRYTLGTQSREWVRLEETDFYGVGESRAKSLKIECVFRGFSHEEAGPFLEWLGFEEVKGQKEYVLRVRFTAQRKRDRIVTALRAGPDEVGISIDGDARDRLRVTYLKPLRDAENELTPGRRSRFAQILRAHPLFQKPTLRGNTEHHDLEKIIKTANKAIAEHFRPGDNENEGGPAGAVLRTVNDLLEEFFAEGDSPSARVKIAGTDLADILQKLELVLAGNPAGLGSLNLLYMAAELLLLQRDTESKGLRLALIEELEAHIHPQAQLRLIHFLANRDGTDQYLLTTHSTTLGASIDLKKLVICLGNKAFPMGPKYTKLASGDYEFLQRFLDATKANLFFARGILLVEGDAENLLIPTIADIIGRPLHRYGVSIVNIGSTAFARYEKIFVRTDGQSMGIKVAVVTDLDVRPLEWYEGLENPLDQDTIEREKGKKAKALSEPYSDPHVKRFVSPNWTLEYEIALSSLRKPFYQAVLWAQKKENAITGTPQESKRKEVTSMVKKNMALWERDWTTCDRRREKIAWEIYGKTMLSSRTSKAIVAQVFASWLAGYPHKQKLRDALLESQSLGYLIEAILHVTESLPKAPTDEHNES